MFAVKPQTLEDQMALVCPEGLLAKGISWYYVPLRRTLGESLNNTKNFSICVNCKPRNDGPYQWIEICFANNENPLGGQFELKTQSCEDKPVGRFNQLLYEICKDDKPVCGLTITTVTTELESALRSVHTIPCTNGTSFTEIDHQSSGHDIDLTCPENSTLYGLERFFLPVLQGSIPVLSALCEPNYNTKTGMIFIYAKGKVNDTKMKQYLNMIQNCPFDFVKVEGTTRCQSWESPSKFCSLRWHSTTIEQSAFDFLNCAKPNKIKPQYMFTIIGACCGLFILLIIIITIHRVKVKKLMRQDDFKKKSIVDKATPNDGNSPVNGEKSEDLCYEEVEDGQISSVSRSLQKRNHKIPIHNSPTIALQSNDRYLYTVPDKEENSMNQATKDTNYMNAEMFIK